MRCVVLGLGEGASSSASKIQLFLGRDLSGHYLS
jgi:hypothetical protein